MTYAAYQAKVFGKKPVWLYEITIGATTTRWTSGRSDYTYSANTYTKEAIKHGRVPLTTLTNRAEVLVDFPATNATAQALRDGTGIEGATIIIRHGYANDLDQEFVVRFRGRVVGTTPMIGGIILRCENEFTRLRRKALPAVMQRPCRHALYHGGCGLAIGDFETAATATDWTSPVLMVTEASGQADGYYDGGIVTFGSRRQMIRRHVGTSLTLLAPLVGVADEITANGSAAVDIAPGCDLTIATCNSKFSNSENFGGFDRMTDSPFDGRNPF